MGLPSPPYRFLASLSATILPVMASVAGQKVARSIRARRGVVQRMEAWGQQQRDLHRPLLWMHAPSVGEGLQAEAVLRVLRARHPDWQLVYTHFSPSAELLAARQEADLTDYLPWDTRAATSRVLEAIRPTALVFAKLDLWPELACQAAARGTQVGLVAATVSPVSSRLRWPAVGLLQSGYASVSAAGAIAEADASRLALLGVPRDRIEVLGDPRFDSTLQLIGATDPADPALRFRQGTPVLVAGSTWPADEAVLLEAFAGVLRVHPEARLILAPHEPTSAHLVGIRARAKQLNLGDPVRLDEAAPDARFILVDRVGVLARLYGSAALAMVGGGFGTAGLHSVIEPAGWGIPISVGPRWQGSREAGLLAEAGGAVVLDGSNPARHLAAWWNQMLSDRGAREHQGRSAAAVINAGRGSAVRQAELVERLMRIDQRFRTATPS
ncbi:MAG: glycosyltransferase N-terminal domain-containing protein [Gemmatimonadota bacterium]|nr:glycosyltransferase N-terminal domain-containing protein [Gemmatimonadota bacterium]